MGDFFLSLMILGALSGDSALPFWATAGQYGLMPESSGSFAMVSAGSGFDEGRTLQWRWGGTVAAGSWGDPVSPKSSPVHLMVDEMYASLRWKVFTLDAGMKHRDRDFLASGSTLGTLSVTGGNMLWSANTRTMPGATLSLEPLAVPFTGGRLKIYGRYGDYWTMDTRYRQGSLVHNLGAYVQWDVTPRLDVSLGLDHYALWGGYNAEAPVNMKVTFKNYLRMALGMHAGADGSESDQINVIGDQRGAELIRVRYRGDGFRLTAQHDIPYDDGSGMGFQNFPDGVNTIHFAWDDRDRWVSDLLYEYHYTMWQSGTCHDRPATEDEIRNGKAFQLSNGEWRKTVGGGDNYFNNEEFKSGWTHFGRTIGDPLMFPAGTHDGTWTPSVMVLGVENNRLKAHHFAMGGKLFRKAPYKLMLTWSRNYGTYHAQYAGESQWQHEWGTVQETALRQFSAGFSGEVPFRRLRGLNFLYGVYADRGEVLGNRYGATLGLRWAL